MRDHIRNYKTKLIREVVENWRSKDSLIKEVNKKTPDWTRQRQGIRQTENNDKIEIISEKTIYHKKYWTPFHRRCKRSDLWTFRNHNGRDEACYGNGSAKREDCIAVAMLKISRYL